MTKKRDTVLNPNVKKNHGKRTPSTKKIRGYDAIKLFLHKVNTTIKEECAKHESLDNLPWYSKWKTWDKQELFESTSINVIGKNVCPDLRYNKRTLQQLIQQILLDITPVSSYIQVNELSDTSVKWESLIEVDSFRSL